MAIAAGMTPEEMVGKSGYDLFPFEQAARYDHDDRDVLALRRPKRIVESMVGKDGREAWYETIKTPIFDERGDVVGTAGVAREVTGRSEAEEIHRQFVDQLDALVRERTAQLERANAALIEELRERRKS
jgi:PAS domain S-box-containing protein